MKKEVFMLVMGLLLVGGVLGSELRVTQEHPFFVDGEWVMASDLKVGDELLSLEGSRVRITGVKNVVENVEVYNLDSEKFDNFIVDDGLVVHNSDVVSKIKFEGIEQIESELVSKIYSERRSLDKLVKQGVKGIIKNTEGNFKYVYIIDLSEIDIELLPLFLKSSVSKETGRFVIKFLKEDLMKSRKVYSQCLIERGEDLVNEIKNMQKINHELGRNVFPEKISMGMTYEHFGEDLLPMFRGIIIEREISGKSLRSFKKEMGLILRSSDDAQMIRFAEKYNKEVTDFIFDLDDVFKKLGIYWLDPSDSNIAVSFKVNGDTVSVSDIKSKRYPVEAIEFEFEVYELGGVRPAIGRCSGILPGSLEAMLPNEYHVRIP